MKLVQYIKLSGTVVHGAPEWVRKPRLPLVGAEREHIASTIKQTIKALAARHALAA